MDASPSQNANSPSAALAELGVSYAWGGGAPAGPSLGTGVDTGKVGFDCSGLALYAYAKVGVAVLHQTQAIWYAFQPAITNPADVQPGGDLILLSNNHRRPSNSAGPDAGIAALPSTNWLPPSTPIPTGWTVIRPHGPGSACCAGSSSTLRSPTACSPKPPRRAASTSWGTPALTSIDFADLWRRDGDDDDPDTAPLPRSGPWRLSYLPRTGEIYAIRRSTNLPEQVWLLGTGLHDTGNAFVMLLELEESMREPNSLIFATQVVHDEQHHPCIAPPDRPR